MPAAVGTNPCVHMCPLWELSEKLPEVLLDEHVVVYPMAHNGNLECCTRPIATVTLINELLNQFNF